MLGRFERSREIERRMVGTLSVLLEFLEFLILERLRKLERWREEWCEENGRRRLIFIGGEGGKG